MPDQNITIEAKAGAWDTLMDMWEDPENAEALDGGDVVEEMGLLRSRLGYVEPVVVEDGFPDFPMNR